MCCKVFLHLEASSGNAAECEESLCLSNTNLTSADAVQNTQEHHLCESCLCNFLTTS